jgi:hypothetical protein
MKKVFLLTLFLSVFLWIDGLAQNEKFKALFMYNFTKYIEWPVSQRQGDFIIGVLGNSPLTKELEFIAGKQKVGTQSIVVKTFSSIDAIENCNILYLPSNKSGQIGQIVAKLNGKPVLIITDKEGLGLQGAGINYISDGDKLKYEVNKGSIEKKGLTVSNSLLALGVLVSN